MKTLLNKLQQIEGFILQTNNPGDKLLFEAHLLLDDNLHQDVNLQKNAYAIINQYGRRKLKADIETVHQQLFTQTKHQRFREKVLALFKWIKLPSWEGARWNGAAAGVCHLTYKDIPLRPLNRGIAPGLAFPILGTF